MPSHPTCVIFNPAAGRGRAERVLQNLPAGVSTGVELRPSTGPGHAVELARSAAVEGFARVVAAGGDGTVHEVANGLLLSERPDVVFSTWPLGSANDYAHTLGMTAWWRELLRGRRHPTGILEVDVGRVRAGGRERYTVNSLGVGFNGMVTVEARKIRRLRGLPLYTLAFLRAMVRHFATPAMSIRFDDTTVDGPTLALTVNVAQREGGFPITPQASLTDGLFDFMHATELKRWQLVRYLPAMATGRLPTGHPHIHLGRCRTLVVRSTAPLCVHADGEFVCTPADGLTDLSVEVVPARLRVEVYRPALYGRLR